MREDRDINELKRKIAALLELAKSEVNEHEAIAAAMKAQELLQKYHLDESDISEFDRDMEILEEAIPGVSNIYWDKLLANAVADNFRCKCYYHSGPGMQFYFVGHRVDVLAASTMYAFLKTVACKQYEKKYAENYTAGIKSHKGSYMMGFVTGVGSKLSENCKDLKLVVPSDVEANFAENHPNLVEDGPPINIYDAHGYESGVRDGKDAADSRGIMNSYALPG